MQLVAAWKCGRGRIGVPERRDRAARESSPGAAAAFTLVLMAAFSAGPGLPSLLPGRGARGPESQATASR